MYLIIKRYKLNILYISQFFSETRGGGEIVFYGYAEGMAIRGHHVDVISHQITNFEEIDLDGVTIHRIRPAVENKATPPSIKQHMMYMINAIIKGSHIIRQNKIDIIHASSSSPVIVGSILAKIHNLPVIITIHGMYTTASGDFWKKWAAQEKVSHISSIIGPRFEKITVKMPVDIIHTVSNAVKEDVLKFNAKSSEKIITIPNGINLKNYDNLGIKKDYQKYMLFIGRLLFYKNLDVVISSFKDVSRKLPEAKLVIIGDGPMRDIWEKMVSDLNLDQNIEFMGHIPHEKKFYEILSQCSALLFPSLYEGFGMVLLEAFAMCKPVLVSDQKVFYEIVDEGIDGFILPPHDVHKWSEKIIFLLSNKTICQDMGNKGRLKVETKFNINQVLDRLESLYTKLRFV